MLTCKEVVRLTSSSATAGKAEESRFSVWLHLAMCRHCRAYTAALERIANMVRQPDFPGRSINLALRNAIVVAVLRDLNRDG